MSGHNKWSKIKRKKSVEDSRRSKAFTKIIKDITIAVKEGGEHPEGNPKLRLALNNAKGVNMPRDTIQRAISKASEKSDSSYSEVTYEGYASGGVAVFVECTTDNINRTVSNVRLIFSKYGGSLGTNGSIAFLFERIGIFTVPRGDFSEDDFTLEMIDGGAGDVQLDEGVFTVTCSFENFGQMQKKFESMNMEPESSELQRIPNSTVTLEPQSARKVLNFIEALEADDDVQNVFHNLELTEEVAAMLQ